MSTCSSSVVPLAFLLHCIAVNAADENRKKLEEAPSIISSSKFQPYFLKAQVKEESILISGTCIKF